MRRFGFRADYSVTQCDRRASPLAARDTHGAPGGRRYARPVDDAMQDAAIVDPSFDNFKIDPAELRASLDAGRNRHPSAE